MLSIKLLVISSISIVIANSITLFSKYLTVELLTPSANMLYIAGGFIIAASIFLSSFGIVIMVAESSKEIVVYYLILMATLAVNLALSFSLTGSSEVIINSLMIILSLILVQYRFKREISNQIKISLSTISNTVGTFMIFTALAVSLNFYILNTQADQGRNSYEKVKSYLYETTSLYVEQSLNSEALKNSLPQFQVEGIYDKQGTSTLIDDQEKHIESQVKSQVNQKINDILDPYEPYFVPVSTLLIFLSIISFTPLVRIFTILFGNLLFNLLKWIKIIEERIETVEVVRYRL